MKHLLFILLLLTLSITLCTKTFGQNIAINETGSLPDTSAMLDISSTSKGFLAPRMTTTQRDLIPLPAVGLMIFNTTTNVFNVNTGTAFSPIWSAVALGTGTTTNTLGSSVNTLTSTVNGVAATASLVNSVSNTSSVNNLTTTINGVAGTSVPMVNSVANNSTTNSLTTTINGVAGTAVNIINSNATSLSGSNLTTTVNGVASTSLDLSPAFTAKTWGLTGNSGTVSGTNFLGTTDNKSLRLRVNNVEKAVLDSNGRWGIGTTTPANTLSVNGNASIATMVSGASTDSLVTWNTTTGLLNKRRVVDVINGATTVSNTSSVNNLTTTVNGVAAISVPMVNSVANSSSVNNLTTTINGVAGTAVNIINSNATSLSGSSLTTTVNGVAATALDLTPAITAKSWGLTGNSGTVSGTNFIGTTDNKSVRFRVNNAEKAVLDSNGRWGIGTTTPANTLSVNGNASIATMVSGASTDSLVTWNTTTGLLNKRRVVDVINGATTVSNTSSVNNLTTTVNGVAATSVPMVNSVANTSSVNNLTTTINGVAGTSVPMVNSVANNSTTNSLTTTINGVAGTAVNIINSNATSLSGSNLITTVNGVAATALDLTPAITAKSWGLTGNSGTVSGTNFIGTTDNKSVRFRVNNAEKAVLDSNGRWGIGVTNPSTLLAVGGTANVTGATTLSSTLGVTGNSTFSGTITASNLPSGAVTDSIVLVNPATNQLKRIDPTSLVSSLEPWYNVATGTGATSPTQNVYHTGNVGIGLTDPGVNLEVADNINIRRTGSVSQLLFANTAGTGDFRIGGDGGDIYWQGGGGRCLQMGSYWATILEGDRQSATFPAFESGVTGTSILVRTPRDGSVPLGIQGYSATQSANLQEWRNSSATTLSYVTPTGAFSIGSTLGVTGATTLSSTLGVSGATTLSGTLTASSLGAGASTDDIVTINASNVVKRVTMASFATTLSPWYASTTTNGATTATQAMYHTGNINIGGTSASVTPSFLISLDGAADRTIGMERNATNNTAGNDFFFQAGGASSGATNKVGGDVYLKSGTSTGNAVSNVYIQTATAGTSGTTDNAPTTKMTVLGNGNVGIGTTSPSTTLGVAGTLDVSGNSNFSGTITAASLGAGTSTDDIVTINASNVVKRVTMASFATTLSPWYAATTTNGATTATQAMYHTGNINIGGTSASVTPSFLISLDGAADRTIGMERNATSNTAGNDFFFQAGGATSGATNKVGGDVYLKSGTSTGNAVSNVYIQTATAGTSGTTDNTPSTKMTVLGSGNVGIGTTAPGALLDLGTAGTKAGVIRLAGSTSGNVSLQTNAAAGTGIVQTLPAITGTVDVSSTTAITAGSSSSITPTAVNTVSPTANITITLQNGVAGQRATFVITAFNTTSRTITFAGNVKTTGTITTGSSSNKVGSVSFVHDGTNWVEVGRVAVSM